MFDHVGFEVTDLERSARFYDALLFALGGRRMFEGPGRDRLRRSTARSCGSSRADEGRPRRSGTWR